MVDKLLQTEDGTTLARFRNDGLEIMVGNVAVLRLEKTGHVYIKNQLVSIDVEVIYGVRELLKNLERDNLKEKDA